MTDHDSSTECRCGRANCRGTIIGKDRQRPVLQQRYRNFCSVYLLKKIRSSTRP
ncbi:MAG TPA: hypothetical protein VK993_14155 [Chthoniobacterales bacterium]|nr:hypothetical protein [Chthoniobacterales bacterium]